MMHSTKKFHQSEMNFSTKIHRFFTIYRYSRIILYKVGRIWSLKIEFNVITLGRRLAQITVEAARINDVIAKQTTETQGKISCRRQLMS